MANRGLRDSLRFLVRPDLKEQINLKTIVVDVLIDTFNLTVSQILCLQDFPGQGIYDVTFLSTEVCWNVFEKAKEKEGTGVLKGIGVIPLFMEEDKMIIVHMYSPFSDVLKVRAFLKNYCEELKGGEKVLNKYKIWTGKYRFFGKFKLDKSCVGGVKRPPAVFSIGGERGYLYYQGQPRYCRKCFSYGHIATECEMTEKCRFCKQIGHKAKDCTATRTCDICQEAGHLANQCPLYTSQKRQFWGTNSKAKSGAGQQEASTSGAREGAGGPPEKGCSDGMLPTAVVFGDQPKDADGKGDSIWDISRKAAEAAILGDSVAVTPGPAEGEKADHAGGPDVVASPPREEDNMDVGVSEEEFPDSPGEVEIREGGMHMASGVEANPSQYSVQAQIGNLSSSEEEEEDEMDSVDSIGSIECGQQLLLSLESAAKRPRSEEEDEEGVLQIDMPGDSEESASSPVTWRKQKMLEETEVEANTD